MKISDRRFFFDEFIRNNNGYILETWNSFCGGRGGNLFCPFCQKDEIGKIVNDNGEDEESMIFATNGRLLVTLDTDSRRWFIRFSCICGTPHSKFYNFFTPPCFF